jgi:hypothetical protein
MRNGARAFAAAIGAFGLCGSALAADLTGEEIKTLIWGNSVYIETSAASVTGKAGQGVIHYPGDGTALYRTPAGPMWHGKTEIKGNTVCTEWKERPSTACSRYDKAGDAVSIIDVATGQARAKITKSAPGNPEKLAP